MMSELRRDIEIQESDSPGLADSRGIKGNGDSELPRSSRGRVRALPARFRDSDIYLGEKKNDDGVKKERKRMRVDRKIKKAEKNEIYRPEDFEVKNLVWAKASKSAPAWPALVIDPLHDAPEFALTDCVSNTTCVMYFGVSKKGKRDYGWIRQGMIYPYADAAYLDRFKRQPLSDSSRPGFFKAMEEAADYGYKYFETGVTNEDKVDSANQHTQEDLEFRFNKLCKSKQYCGICKKIWYQSNSGNWIRCDGCRVWVHAECANISNNPLKVKDIQEKDYYCPKCEANLICEESASQRLEMVVGQAAIPGHIPVICNGMEGIYYPALHLVECKCGFCGTRKWKLCEWEHHTGSKSKKWKASVIVKDSMLPLEKWILQHNLQGVNPPGLSKQQLFTFLQEKYEPVCSKWSLGRCAVCRRIEDHDHDKIIICKRCQIAVHQECYGVSSDENIASWVCRVCEEPDIKRECCLCPVKGGALKPTDVDNLWVHVTCGWFCPQVEFSCCWKMEPAVGLLQIPLDSFVKACSICKQIHGSCIQCCKCKTSFHAMCALLAGFHMDVRCGKKIEKVSYCALHRAPNTENGITMDKETLGATILNQSNKNECPNSSTSGTSETESAARCCLFKSSKNKKIGIEPRFHRLMGPTHHSLDAIDSLTNFHEDVFSTLTKRLNHLKETENQRVCFGKSGIHGWGLFARRRIREGDMVLEYRGEKVQESEADLREARYRLEGKDCYMIRIGDKIIDATVKGNLARLINHSCMPNCFARIVSVGEVDNKIFIIAKTDVSAGDELTLGYSFEEDGQDEIKITEGSLYMPSCPMSEYYESGL